MTVVSPAAERTPSLATSMQYPKSRWAVLATTCFTVISFQVSAMSYGPLLGEIARNLGVSLAQAVNLMSIFMLFAALSFFAAGPLCDKYGAPAVIVISTLFSSVPTAATFWLGHAYASAVVIRALQGCSVGFVMAGMAPLVLQWFPPHQRGLALGIPGACMPLGAIIGVLASPVLYRSTGSWQHTVALLSGFGWFALAYCVIVFTLAKSHTPHADAAPGKQSVSAAFSAAMRSPFTWVGVLSTFAVNWIVQSAFSLSPSYFAEPKPVGLGLGPLAAGQLMGVVQIGAIIGPIVGGLLLDKVLRGKARAVLSLGFALALTYGALQFSAIYNTRILFLLFLALSGAGIGMLFPMVQSRINELYDHQIVGRMNGVWLGLGAFGGSAGLFANSIALNHTGSYILPINIISAAAVLGLILCALRLQAAKSA